MKSLPTSIILKVTRTAKPVPSADPVNLTLPPSVSRDAVKRTNKTGTKFHYNDNVCKKVLYKSSNVLKKRVETMTKLG